MKRKEQSESENKNGKSTDDYESKTNSIDLDFEELPDKEYDEQKDNYWENLQPLVYETREEAESVSLKQFMLTHIRKFIPGHYKGLLKGDEILKSWAD